MLRQKGAANHRGYQLVGMLWGTNSNKACTVLREMKWKYAMPPVLLDQSSIEMMLRSGNKGKRPNNISESALAKHSRKENLTKDDIPTIVEAILKCHEVKC